MQTYYEILEIKQSASLDEITQAYRRLALIWQPDKNIDNQEKATSKFKEIVHAYDTLKEPSKRKIYDASLPTTSAKHNNNNNNNAGKKPGKEEHTSSLADLIRAGKDNELIAQLNSDHVKVTLNDLQLAIEKKRTEIIKPICNALTKRGIALTEYLVELAIQKFTSDFDFSNEGRDLKTILAVMDAVVASGKQVSESTLVAINKHAWKTHLLNPVLDAIIKTGGALSTTPLKSAIERKDAVFVHGIGSALITLKIPVTEDLAMLAIQNFTSDFDFSNEGRDLKTILAVMDAVVASGKQVSESTLVAINKHAWKTHLLNPVLDAIIKSAGKLSFDTLKTCLNDKNFTRPLKEKALHAYFKSGGELTDAVRNLASAHQIHDINSIAKTAAMQQTRSIAAVINILRQKEGLLNALPSDLVKSIVNLATLDNSALPQSEKTKAINEIIMKPKL